MAAKANGTAPLAIASTAASSSERLIDALPYVDQVRADVKPIVDALIEEEKRNSKKLPSDYLRELPPVRAPQFEDHPVLKTEFERVRSKQPLQPLDTTRYRLDPPPQTKRNDPNAWQAALNNAHSQLEHQHLRIMNQELLLKHGDKAWRAQVQLDEAAVKSLELQLAAIKKETDQLNRERKLQQHAAGSELTKLERQYMAQIRKNFDIERACDRLDAEVTDMEERLQKRIRVDTGAAEAGADGRAGGAQEPGQQHPDGPAEQAASGGSAPEALDGNAASAAPNGTSAPDTPNGVGAHDTSATGSRIEADVDMQPAKVGAAGADGVQEPGLDGDAPA